MKFDYNEVYRILNELQANGHATGNSLYRDTVNHYYEINHKDSDPTAIVVTDIGNDLHAHYSIKHVDVSTGYWRLI